MKYYRLLKDLPDLKAGEMFSRPIENDYKYLRDDSNKYMYVRMYHKGYDEGTWYSSDNVENNPEWFEEVYKCEKCGEFSDLDFKLVSHAPECCNKKKTVKIEKMEHNKLKLNDIENVAINLLFVKSKINEIIEKIND